MNLLHGKTAYSLHQDESIHVETQISVTAKGVGEILVPKLEGGNDFHKTMKREFRINLPLKSKFWGDIRMQHKEWFICLHPNRTTQKKWLLKDEYLAEFYRELDVYIKRIGR